MEAREKAAPHPSTVLPSRNIASCLDPIPESRARPLSRDGPVLPIARYFHTACKDDRLCVNQLMKTLARTTDDLIGTFRTFGEEGPVYEVMRKVDAVTVRIVVVETGEELNYPAAEALKDPEAA